MINIKGDKNNKENDITENIDGKDNILEYNEDIENILYNQDILNIKYTEHIIKINKINHMNIILIAGGAGFLGTNLCYELIKNKNNYIICIDNLITGSIKNINDLLNNNNFCFFKIDITNRSHLSILYNLNKIDQIFNLACIASPDKYKLYSIETMHTCFIGNINLLELTKKYNSKFLFTSTSEVYGDPLVHPQPEEYYGNVNILGERSCYDEGKRISETLIYEYKKKYNLHLKIVRIFNTYGPFMDINDGRIITNFIKQIKSNEKLKIYGSGKQTRSFCYVDDMINGLILMMNSNELGPINIGNPNCEFTLNELVTIFEKILKKNLEIEYLDETENDPKQRKPIIDKAINKLKWSPSVILEEGLLKTIKYFGL